MTTQGYSAVARAKINLALHVVGQTDNGFHLLDSLVCFCEYGDQVTLKPSIATSIQSLAQADGSCVDLSINGQFAVDLGNSKDNLVSSAAANLRSALTAIGITCPPVNFILEKNLPVASGIGGGSADAAAVLNLLMQYWMPITCDKQPSINLKKIALALGADVPMCLDGEPKRVSGIGENIQPIPHFPALNLVLINSGDQLATPAIFKNLNNKHNQKIEVLSVSDMASISSIAKYLSRQRNDLQPVASKIAPEIDCVIKALSSQNNCLLARMSGSGATCYGIFNSKSSAAQAALKIKAQHRDWWVIATKTIPGEAALSDVHESTIK